MEFYAERVAIKSPADSANLDAVLRSTVVYVGARHARAAVAIGRPREELQPADWIPCPLLPTASATVDMSGFGFWCDAIVAQVGCQLSYAAPSCTSAGPVTADMVADDSGHLWAARPWIGDLIRISAASGVYD